jgi:guanylate kinase
MSLKQKGYKIALTCTTRPIRPNETQDVHYHFTTRLDFESLIANDLLIEYDEFNDWYYGLPKNEWERADVFILTPRGLKSLIKIVGRPMMNIIYMDTTRNIRMNRSIIRGDDQSEVNRRLNTDDNDFAEFIESGDWDMRLDLRIDDKFALISDLFSPKKELSLQHSI